MLELILIVLAWRNGWRGYALFPSVVNAILFLSLGGYAQLRPGVYDGLSEVISDILTRGLIGYTMLGVSVSLALASYWAIAPLVGLVILAVRRRTGDSTVEAFIVGGFFIFLIILLLTLFLKARFG